MNRRYNARYSKREETHQRNVDRALFSELSPYYVYIRFHLVSDLLHLHIFQSTCTFSIPFFSDAVPSINPKILSFIISLIGGERKRLDENIRTINSIRSRSKSEPIGFEWQFGKSFKFLLLERYFRRDNVTLKARSCFLSSSVFNKLFLEKIDRVINPVIIKPPFRYRKIISSIPLLSIVFSTPKTYEINFPEISEKFSEKFSEKTRRVNRESSSTIA